MPLTPGFRCLIKGGLLLALLATPLAAVRMWRFLPQVKNGHAIETHADMPIDFEPPREKSTKS